MNYLQESIGCLIVLSLVFTGKAQAYSNQYPHQSPEHSFRELKKPQKESSWPVLDLHCRKDGVIVPFLFDKNGQHKHMSKMQAGLETQQNPEKMIKLCRDIYWHLKNAQERGKEKQNSPEP